MTDRPSLPDFPLFCKGPYRACDITGKIWGVDEFGGSCMLMDVRGWGYLTGHGIALGLSGDEAIEAQKKTARFVVDMLNEKLGYPAQVREEGDA